MTRERWLVAAAVGIWLISTGVVSAQSIPAVEQSTAAGEAWVELLAAWEATAALESEERGSSLGGADSSVG